jgi:hypothetical protein
MSRDKRLNRTQEVDGSIPISPTKINDTISERARTDDRRGAFGTGPA